MASPTFEKERQALLDRFNSGETKSLEWRLKQLRALDKMFNENYDAMVLALGEDLGRPEAEAGAEIAVTHREIRDAISGVATWIKPQTSWAPILVGPSTAEVRNEPFGAVLIIGPFNYPINLCGGPLTGALVAGNTVMMKPSELSPATAKFYADTIPKYFPSDVISVACGGIPVSTALLNLKWNFVFFTGSPRVGKIVAQACAPTLTPYVLELGGKAPCVITPSCGSISEAARRIVYAKYVNVGQTCVAPDYVMCHEDAIDEFCEAAVATVKRFYLEDPKKSTDYGRMVAVPHARRQAELMSTAGGKVLCGGPETADPENKYIPPTIIREPDQSSKVLTEEIFGPILSILPFKTLDEVIDKINGIDKTPLAFYVFATDTQEQEKLLNSVQSGDAIINDCLLHTCVGSLPFGGVGTSGCGAYHGKYSFEAFSYKKSVLHRPSKFCLSYTVPTPEGNIKDPPTGPMRKKGLPLMIKLGPELPPMSTLKNAFWVALIAILAFKFRDSIASNLFSIA